MKTKISFVTNSSSTSFLIISKEEIKEKEIFAKVDISNKVKVLDINDQYTIDIIKDSHRLSDEQKKDILEGKTKLYEIRIHTEDFDLLSDFMYDPTIETSDPDSIVLKEGY